MKKLLVTTLAIGLVLTLGVGFANDPSASHSVDIKIPNVLFLRITNGTNNARLDGTTVNFDFTEDADAINRYLDHVTDVDDNTADPWIGSTDGTPAFGDVIVFSNRNEDWRVTVAATTFATGFDLANVRVTPSGTNGSGATLLTANEWTLSTAAQDIFTGGTRTKGWKSLGFSAADYEIKLDGNETHGTYTTTVTYTILQP